MAENGLKSVLPWVGVMVLFFGASSTAGVALWRIDASDKSIETLTSSVAARFSAERSMRMAQVDDLEESMDEIEDLVDQIEKQQLLKDGQSALTIQQIKGKVDMQDEKLDTIIEWIEEQRRSQ